MSNYVESRRSLIEQNGFGLSMTQGTSMRPLIWGGRHCVAVAPLTEEPRRGDLLMFREARANREINIVHRLVEVVEEDGHTVYSTRRQLSAYRKVWPRPNNRSCDRGSPAVEFQAVACHPHAAFHG